jgi:KEOPS complex subunit Cgi121
LPSWKAKKPLTPENPGGMYSGSKGLLMRMIITDSQPSLTSGDRMVHPPVLSDIRAAGCTVHDLTAFLQDLRSIAADHGTHIICFNADMLAGRVHGVSAVERAVLLFAAGSRQCSIAASFGIHEGENRMYICCYPARAKVWVALEPLFHFVREEWDTIDPEKRGRLMKTFSITPEELAAAGGNERIVDLVLERVALLQAIR